MSTYFNLRPEKEVIHEKIRTLSQITMYPNNKLDLLLKKQINDITQNIRKDTKYNSLDDDKKEDIDVFIMQQIWHYIFSKMPSWGMVTYLYIKFLEGDIRASPLHFGALTLDVRAKGVQDLININRLGYLTTDSQPGICEKFTNPFNNKKGEEKQRQYISGYMLKNLYQSFAEYLKVVGNDNVAFDIIDSNNSHLTRHYPDWSESNNENKINYGPFIKNNDILPLTFSKFDDEDEWTLDSRLDRAISNTLFEKPEFYGPYFPGQSGFTEASVIDFHQWIKNNTVYVAVYAKDFCQPNVLNDLVLRALVE